MQTQTDFLTAPDLRDFGMQQALDNANRQIEEWSEEAMDYLKSFLQERGTEPFQAEDFRFWAIKKGINHPPTWRAIGGIFTRARRCGLISFLRIEPTSNPPAHCANASLWVKA